MALHRLSSSSKVDDERKKLARQQQELKKIEARLQKQLVRMPKEIEKKKKLDKIQVAAAIPTVSLGGARSHRSKTPALRKGGRLRSQINGERIKFLVLCLILATILAMLWRAVPS